jgi:hypothetical protein
MRNEKNDTDDPTGAFRKIDQMLPRKKGHTPRGRCNGIESALNWSRNQGTVPIGDEEAVPAFNHVGSVPISRRSPEDRQKDVDNVLTWDQKQEKRLQRSYWRIHED